MGEKKNNPYCINYFVKAPKSSGPNSGKLEQTLHRRQINVPCATIQTQLYENAEVKLATTYPTFEETEEEKEECKNSFFRFFAFDWDSFVSVWIEKNSRDNRLKALQKGCYWDINKPRLVVYSYSYIVFLVSL